MGGRVDGHERINGHLIAKGVRVLVCRGSVFVGRMVDGVTCHAEEQCSIPIRNPQSAIHNPQYIILNSVCPIVTYQPIPMENMFSRSWLE